MRTLRSRLTYANVISTLCLFIVLGGGAYAAKGGLGPESVGTKHLKDGAVTGVKIKKATIDASKLTPAALASLGAPTSLGAPGPAGAPGPQGLTGPQGIQGPQGLTDSGAYATVGQNEDEEIVFLGAHPGFAAVERPGPEGVYCLTPTQGTNVDHPVASIDWAGSGGARARFVEPLANGVVFVCDEGDFEVRTFELASEEPEPEVVKWVPVPANGLGFTVFAPGT